MLKVITWNVNSIKMRETRTLKLLETYQPDILCLQELKCVEEAFPPSISKMGYQPYLLGQKTYNGVAIISKEAALNVTKKLAPDDLDARWIGTQFKDLTVYSAYIPNGQEVGSEKYLYKLNWFEKLYHILETTHQSSDPILLCGDFNVAPEDRDVYDPVKWKDQILCSEKERASFQKILQWGLKDCFRELNPEAKEYSWWDYRALGFPLNHGLRIDFILASENLFKKCVSAKILREERKGEKPSDHAPIYCEFSTS